MSYHSKAFLADRERLLEPDTVLRKGSRVWHQDEHTVHTVLVLPPPDYRTEAEIEAAEDEYLKSKGI